MIATLRETTRANEEQDWLKSNLARIAGLMQGQRDLVEVAELIMSELTPLVDAQLRRVLPGRPDADGDRAAAPDRAGTATVRLDAGRRRDTFGARARGWSARPRWSAKPILVDRRAAGYLKIASGLGEAAPASLVVLPVLFEDQVLGVIELASFTRSASAPGLPRPARGDHRRRAQHHHRQLAHRGAARRVPAARHRAAGAVGRAAAPAGASCSAPTPSWRRRPRCWPSRTATSRCKNIEIEQARRALEERPQQLALVLAVQVGVPGQHVARAAHPAELAADPREAAGRQPRRQPHRPAGRVRQHHPQRGLRPAAAHQRHPRPVQGRGGQDGRRPGRRCRWPGCCELRRGRRSGRWPRRRAWTSRSRSRPDVPADAVTDEQRLQQVLRNLLSNAVKFTAAGEVELRIARRRPRRTSTTPTLTAHADVLAFAVTDTGIGIAPDKLDGHLRGVPAGRRHHQPQVRRHRPRPVDQPGDRPAARRRDPRDERAGPGAARSRCTSQSAAALPAARQPHRTAVPPRRSRAMVPRARRRHCVQRALATPAGTARTR